MYIIIHTYADIRVQLAHVCALIQTHNIPYMQCTYARCEQLTLWLHHTQLTPLDTQVAQLSLVVSLHSDEVLPTEIKTDVIAKTRDKKGAQDTC